MDALITEWQPDASGVWLGTGFMRFKSTAGISGLARLRDGRLDLLAIEAEKPHHGQLRQFILTAKTHYSAITVLDIWDDWLKKALARYGFTPWVLVEQDEQVPGMMWRTS